MKFKEGQLVCVNYLVSVNTGDIISTNLAYNNEPEYKRNFNVRKFDVWVRVKFIDTDGTFVGEAERIERNTWSELTIKIFEKGEHVRIGIDRVYQTEDPDKEFCYSDNVTQCSCPGLCRNK